MSGQVSADEIAGGFWYPGRDSYYIGDTFGDLNAHQHLTAYIGFIVRLAHEANHRRLDREEINAALGMQLVWHFPLLQDVARAAKDQAAEVGVPTPTWVASVAEIDRRILALGPAAELTTLGRSSG